MKKLILFVTLIITLNAGVYTQKLVQCMVKNSTPQDIKTLKTWMFFAFAQDPDLSKYAKITPGEKVAVNKKMGAYVTKLLTEKCPSELKNAVKYDGPQSIPVAFEYLGRVAGAAITSSPEVKKFFMEFSQYVDMKKLNSLIK